MLVISLIVILSTFQQASAQKIDSLKFALSNGSINRSDGLRLIAYEYVDVNNKQASEFADSAFLIAKTNGDSLRMVKAGRVQTSALRRMEKIDQAIKVSEKVLSIARRNQYGDEIKALLNPMAVAYTLGGHYDRALNLYFELLSILNNDNSNEDKRMVLNNIGLVFFKLRNYKKAVDFYNKSLVSKAEHNDQNEYRILINIGLCYNELQQFGESQKYFNRGLSLCGEKCLDRIVIEGEFGLGVAYFGMKEYEKATERFTKSYNISVRINDKRFTAENLIYLGRLALVNGNINTAKHALLTAENIAVQSSYTDIKIETCKHLSTLNLKLKNFQDASLYLDKYIQLKKSISGEELTQNIMALGAEYEQNENSAKLQAQKRSLVLNEEIIKKQIWLNILACITFCLLVTVIAVMFNVNQQKKKDARLLNQRVLERTQTLEETHRLIENACEGKNQFFLKLSNDIKGLLSTIQFSATRLNPNNNIGSLHKQYLNKMRIAVNQLSSVASRLFPVKEEGC